MENQMTNIVALKAANASRWSKMHISAARMQAFHATGLRLCAPDTKARFQGVTDRLVELKLQPVPWWFIAVVSEREYGPDKHGNMQWDKQLGQGDALALKSHNVPAGMGPYLYHPGDVTPGFDAWTRCCVDVLENSAPFAAKWTDWSVGGTLTLFEEYNGLGYAARGVPSAYVWSGTDQYVSGKYVRDHIYRANVKDVQEGCAPILAMMMAIDPSIQFGAVA
jgi:lysozyme family protein